MVAEQNQGFGAKSTAIEVLGDTDLTGKVAIVTGGNKGLGTETVKTLAIGGCKVYITARNVKEGEEVRQKLVNEGKVKGEILVSQLDLTNFESIHNFSKDFMSKESRLDFLILNAGVAFTPLKYTMHDLEFQFGTNHMGHFALTTDVIEFMKKQDFESRVVVVASLGHMLGSVDIKDPNFKQRKYSPFAGYGQSKTANMLFTLELAKRLEGTKVKAYCLHPGTIETNLGVNTYYTGVKFMDKLIQSLIVVMIRVSHPGEYKNLQQGASTTIFACVSPSIENNSGAYLKDCKIDKPLKPWAEDPELAKQVWELSEQIEDRINKEIQAKQ